jgi:hypothetical protein
MSRTAHCTVAGGAGSGDDAGRDPADPDFADPDLAGADDFADPDFDCADDFDDAGRDVVRDAGDDAGRDDRPERDESDDGLLPVGSLSVNDLNMGCPIVTR